MRTRAVRDGDHYVLTGRKLWITNAGVCDFYTVFAKTDPDAGHRGISASSSRRRSRASRIEARAQARCARLTDRRDRARRLRRAGREPHRRRRPRLRVRDGCARPFAAARRRAGARHRAGCARARGAVRAGARAVRPRIADFQGVQFMLADMATQVDAARLLVYRACALLDAGRAGHRERRRRWRSCSRPTPRCGSRPTACSSSAASGYTKDIAGGAVHARREDHPDLRGHEPDPAHRDREAPARGLTVTIRYASRGDAHIAYDTIGDGPIDILHFVGFILPIDALDESHTLRATTAASRRSAA